MARKSPDRANGRGSDFQLMERLEPTEPKRCDQCGREFIRTQRARFCSDRCRQRWNMPRKRIAVAAWKVAHPLEVWCHRAFNTALKKGLIDRKPCEICGSHSVDGHHEVYTEPLKVRWLCRRHHKRVHLQDERP